MNDVSLVITVLGEDQPGVVKRLAEVVTANGGNWLESRMAHLAGQFAGVLRVEVAADQAQQLDEALQNLTQHGLQLVVRKDDSPVGTTAPAATEIDPSLVELDLVGQDQPGIVNEITRVLSAHDVNVEDLTTEQITAATTGQKLFRAAAKLHLPEGASVEDLRNQLEKIASDLMVDITLE